MAARDSVPPALSAYAFSDIELKLLDVYAGQAMAARIAQAGAMYAVPDGDVSRWAWEQAESMVRARRAFFKRRCA